MTQPTPNPEFRDDTDYEKVLAIGLAYAVGRFEGAGEDTGLAGKTLDLYMNPRVLVVPVDEGK